MASDLLLITLTVNTVARKRRAATITPPIIFSKMFRILRALVPFLVFNPSASEDVLTMTFI
jgi:hypothetical protein